MVNKVLTRTRPGLPSAINDISFIINNLSATLNEIQLESLLIGLEYLIEETELPRTEKLNESYETIPVNDRPACRKLAARLAHSLFRLFSDEKKEIPETLFKWMYICQTDALPEVTREWH